MNGINWDLREFWTEAGWTVEDNVFDGPVNTQYNWMRAGKREGGVRE